MHGTGDIGLREFASTASSAIAALLEMYVAYEQGRETNPGKAPVFACTGVKPVSGKHGTNYSPLFRLTGWVDRGVFEAAGNSAPAPAVASTWTLDQCKAECAAVGISYEMLVSELKARGEKTFNAARATPIVRELIAAARAGQDDPFAIASPPREEDIPF